MPIIIDVMCRRSPSNEMHAHDCAELWYALSGEGVHRVGDIAYRQTPGVCIAVPSFVAHTFSTEHSEDTPVFLRINVSDKAMRERGYNYFSYHSQGIYFDGGLLPVYHHFSGDAFECANSLAHRISDEFSKHKGLDINKLIDLYVSFIRLLGSEKTTFRLTPSILERTERLLTATDYLSDNYSETITIEQLCKLTNMSRSCFSEYFTKLTGVSPMYYLKCIRLTNARKEFMLRGKTLSEIAKLTGFYGKEQLSRMFKEHYGESLSAQKEKNQLHELLFDRETRKRLATLDELSEFFKARNGE